MNYHYLPLSSLIPAKMVREWKILFLSGKPLFDDTEHIDFEDSSSSSSDGSDKKEPDDILDETDIQDYLVRTVLIFC